MTSTRSYCGSAHCPRAAAFADVRGAGLMAELLVDASAALLSTAFHPSAGTFSAHVHAMRACREAGDGWKDPQTCERLRARAEATYAERDRDRGTMRVIWGGRSSILTL